MERYIQQLIEDLRLLISKMKTPEETEIKSVHDDESFRKHIEDVENYLHGEQIPVSTITGILKEQLPPPEKLNKQQKKKLATEMEIFLRYLHFELDFPRKYPVHLRYSFIRNFWDEKHAPMSYGTTHIEFCDYNKENCPFTGYCKTCEDWDYTADMEDFQNRKNADDADLNELPF